jgi:hypothetical protein
MGVVRDFPQKLNARIDGMETAAEICDWHAKDAESEGAYWEKHKVPILAAAWRASARSLRLAAKEIRDVKGRAL